MVKDIYKVNEKATMDYDEISAFRNDVNKFMSWLYDFFIPEWGD
jgi:hypothetical protein